MRVAVTGAAGAYGGYMVELGKAAGLVVVADASERDTELVRRLGADVVLPRGDDFAARVRALYPDGVDGLADGSVQNELLIPAVRDGFLREIKSTIILQPGPAALTEGLQALHHWIALVARGGQYTDAPEG